MTKLFSTFKNTSYILNDCHYLAVNNIFHPKRYIVVFTLFTAQNLMNLRMQLHILGVFMFQLSFLNIKLDRKFSKVIRFLFCHLVSSRIEKHLNKNTNYLYSFTVEFFCLFRRLAYVSNLSLIGHTFERISIVFSKNT